MGHIYTDTQTSTERASGPAAGAVRRVGGAGGSADDRGAITNDPIEDPGTAQRANRSADCRKGRIVRELHQQQQGFKWSPLVIGLVGAAMASAWARSEGGADAS